MAIWTWSLVFASVWAQGLLFKAHHRQKAKESKRGGEKNGAYWGICIGMKIEAIRSPKQAYCFCFNVSSTIRLTSSRLVSLSKSSSSHFGFRWLPAGPHHSLTLSLNEQQRSEYSSQLKWLMANRLATHSEQTAGTDRYRCWCSPIFNIALILIIIIISTTSSSLLLSIIFKQESHIPLLYRKLWFNCWSNQVSIKARENNRQKGNNQFSAILRDILANQSVDSMNQWR